MEKKGKPEQYTEFSARLRKSKQNALKYVKIRTYYRHSITSSLILSENQMQHDTKLVAQNSWENKVKEDSYQRTLMLCPKLIHTIIRTKTHAHTDTMFDNLPTSSVQEIQYTRQRFTDYIYLNLSQLVCWSTSLTFSLPHTIFSHLSYTEQNTQAKIKFNQEIQIQQGVWILI